MAVHKKTEKLFSLKDLLFNEAKIKRLAEEIQKVYPTFAGKQFCQKIVSAFPEQELMERIVGIRDVLFEFLPKDYLAAVKIIIAALPPPLDPAKFDNDFGEFIYAPYSYYIAKYGCSKKYLKVSLKALEEITKRFSAEAALRDFINEFPAETLAAVVRWSKAKNYHVRRLASEGTRPNLPWAKKITYDAQVMLPILDTLHADRTRYVTRSVANHLNDISKFDADLVIDTLKRWQKEKKQTEVELQFIIKHALRTLIKNGHSEAQALLGFSSPKVVVKTVLTKKQLKVGETQFFTVTVTNQGQESQSILVHYLIHFKKANGTKAPKVFLLGKKILGPKEIITLTKSHGLKPMTTRVLHSGEHLLEIKINGVSFGCYSFDLQ
jgi:3-methyladenine DNA glycosylase AlkC